MAPTRITLIRHSQAHSNLNGGQEFLPDPPLTTEGERQCEELHSALLRANIGADMVLISPLLRTLQTAAGALGYCSSASTLLEVSNVKIYPELQETGNVPSDTPRDPDANLDILSEWCPSAKTHFDAWDWSDTMRKCSDWRNNKNLFAYSEVANQERARLVLRRLANMEGHVVVVSHGAFIRYLLGVVVKTEDEWQKGYYYNNCEARSYNL